MKAARSHPARNINIDARGLRLIVLPSLFSASLYTLVVLFVAIGPIGFQAFTASSLRQLWESTQAIDTSTVQGAYQAVYGEPTLSRGFNTIFLFMLWSLVGLLVYSLLVGVYDTFRSAEELQKESGYVNAGRAHPFRTALVRVAVRVGVLAVWCLYCLAFLHWVVPYALALMHVASRHLTGGAGVGYALGACGLLWWGLHIHVVLCRLLLLRVRVFHSEPYV